MSSTVKGLIAGIAAVILLGGGIAAMKLTEPKPETADSSSAADESVPLKIYEGDYNDIKTLSVKNKNGGYTLKRTYRAASAEEQSRFEIAELENVKLDAILLSEFAPNAATLTASKLIEENCQDFSRFGLDLPETEVTIAFDGENKQDITLLVGNDTPSGDVYVRLKDSDTVYSAASSFIKSYSYEKEYFVSRVVLEEPAEEDFPIVSSIKVHRTDLEHDIVLEYAGESESGGTTATHVMTSPVNAYLDISDSVNYTHGLFGLSADSVLSIAPTEEERSFAGIDEPLCTVVMKVEDGTEYVLRIGNRYDKDGSGQECYIGYFEGTDILWLFNADSVPWVTMKPEDAMSSLVFGSYIYDLSSLEVTSDSRTAKFSFEGSSADDYKVKLDGNDYDLERYKQFYQALIKAPAEEICLTDEGIGRLMASVVLSYNNGKEKETVEFYETDENKVIIKKNGVTSFRCRSSFVEKALIPNILKLQGNEEFVTNW
ncbi:MAG: DUF4340 domain-containing protein [Ruminococcus sp.]|nr:DUF4340 domain-containing protein [Ruminococcus sp.]